MYRNALYYMYYIIQYDCIYAAVCIVDAMEYDTI